MELCLGLSLSFCAVLFIVLLTVMLLCPRDITITKHYCNFYAVKPLDFPTILSLSLPRNLVTKFFVIHIVVWSPLLVLGIRWSWSCYPVYTFLSIGSSVAMSVISRNITHCGQHCTMYISCIQYWESLTLIMHAASSKTIGVGNTHTHTISN